MQNYCYTSWTATIVCLSLYELYEGKEAGPQSTQQPVQMDDDDEEDIYGMNSNVQEIGS